jgi:hypothetical protein
MFHQSADGREEEKKLIVMIEREKECDLLLEPALVNFNEPGWTLCRGL